jgi:antitoxin component YwqK of YwqJK toxin-antitoxin module
MKYHYIKFQYSYPVEEKIWESNQLSVRYLYDWRDSIYFMPDDIVQTNTVQNLLYKFGLLQNQYNQPYYGRPSLIEKTGIDYHMTKYFPNDTVSRDGEISAGKKVGCWQFYGYDGEKLYEVEYFDSIVKLNDTIQFKSKGILSDYDNKGNLLSKSFVIEKFEKYDCSHTDHYEVRQFFTLWEADTALHRMNGYSKNYYDNGTIQSEGKMKNGLPEGIWKYYDPFGKLNHVGQYVLGKRDGRWLSGDLSKTKYLGDICMNPNLPDLEEQMKYQEKLIDIYIRYFKMGTLLNSESYGVNLNDFETEKSETDNLEEEIEEDK